MSKLERISMRVTAEEKEVITKKAEAENTTITALVLKSIEKSVTVKMDTSDYRDLVIQFRRIGNNINQVIKNVKSKNIYSTNDMLQLNKHLKEIESLMKLENDKINNTRKSIENITPKKANRLLKEGDIVLPKTMIFENVGEQIQLKLTHFIYTLENKKFEFTLIDFIEAFLERFVPYLYTYEELIEFSNELENVLYKINQRMFDEDNLVTREDFDLVLKTLNLYRKKQ